MSDEQDQIEEQEQSEADGAEYIGDGDFYPGVPTRDLDAEEWGALDEELREICLDLELYEEK